MSTVNKIEIPEEVILKQDVALPLLRYILAHNIKHNRFNFENEKLTVQFSYYIKVAGFDFDYRIATKYIFRNKDEFNNGFSLIEFKIIDNEIVYTQDKYFILTWEDFATDLPHSSAFFIQVLEMNEIVALKVAEEFFDNHNSTNTFSLINQLKAKY